ncbi:tRNA uridine-5-carboxymethylaminomethyl(34) synthesis enzyme MnmG [Mycoplasma marinum]|uniref:tRNA uridine 5-carboxymethylaminomethyl modification enzyme MnmG n=1 Tax=Mycoplasma marinum TaxID=1937190 RepID=A0A4R0XME0_9MOLU|nr:tRNA uridine-5-carboxymethylaminomethyl(34) synthesis enzyme MnmG [Mycoplasma marinum]TCG11882.1 tRNA uridine-5-carboxymethylaminomethyl(34) synthesis enzyme MnmG [Mycoplasma marinum]
MNKKQYEAIVIGGGHAGMEAAFALANKQHKTALISLDKTKLAMMPCNPSIGGPAKGIITREIDALGGMQGLLSDKAMIQIKMLNESKGPAVRALRAQIDKDLYSELMFEETEKLDNLDVIEDMVSELIIKENKVVGVQLEDGEIIEAKVVIITTGTYMDSYILRGANKDAGGPDGQRTTTKLSESLKQHGFDLIRLKTGTPPRVLTSSIDFSEVDEEILPISDYTFSSRSGVKLEKQIHCWITYTNEETHKLIDKNVNKSSMYSGLINGVGPRYCPSIEDKIIRFRDKPRHQIFLEPETKEGDWIYVNGLSTSMPIDIQDKMLRTIPGMKNAEVVKWAYAIEYDAINSLQLKRSFEAKHIQGLYFAGQVNGTSGYEEAAGQGLYAGINAALKLEDKEPIVITRDAGYLGVLIDDLVTKGTKEPYRMLTSRAEYRLLLRNDNADKRLSGLGNQVGLIDDETYKSIVNKYDEIDQEIERLSKTHVSSNSELAQKYEITNGPSYLQVISRPDVEPTDVTDFKYIYELTTQVRLKGYIKKQITQAKKMLRLEKLKLPEDLDYKTIANLATEARQKLTAVRPETIGQASRISGINPADIQMLMFHLNLRYRKEEQNED